MGDRPNVLSLLSDDQRYDTIGALGNARLRAQMDRHGDPLLAEQTPPPVLEAAG